MEFPSISNSRQSILVSIEFDKCVKEMGYLNTPWNLKLFYKWINGKPLFVIAHSDDFSWFGSEDVFHEWDVLEIGSLPIGNGSLSSLAPVSLTNLMISVIILV